MKTTNLFAIAALAVATFFGAQPAEAQTVTLSTTTLGAAITTTTQTTIQLASTSTMLSAGVTNQVNTALYVDQEYMTVVSVVDSTHVTVKRAQGTGNGGRPFLHNNGQTVYFGNTQFASSAQFQISAPRLFAQGSTSGDIVGTTCVAATELVVPKIYVFTGKIYDCLGGAWAQTNGPNTPVYGSTVASATTIAATGNVFKVSGTTSVATITVPNGFAPGQCLAIIPTGIFATTTAGNISKISTSVVGQTLFECWDGSKFNGSY